MDTTVAPTRPVAVRSAINRFLQVKEILDEAVGGPAVPVPGPHGAFWRKLSVSQFVEYSLFGLQLVTMGDGARSTIVRALRGEAQFGQDVGTIGAQFRRMPAGRAAIPPDQIDFIARWIDEGCPEDEPPLGPIKIRLNGAASGEGFVIVSTPEQPLPAILTIRTIDGSEADVVLQVRNSSGASVECAPRSVHVSGEPTAVEVRATSASAARNDTAVAVVRGTDQLSLFELTAIAAPLVRFTGRFQCRLATNPDPYDHPWGERSAFGTYAVQGPDGVEPDEPPLDRIIRFQDAVALRPFCDPIGVAVVAIEADLSGSRIQFTAGDPLLGLPVRVGPDCKFDSRDGSFAPDGFEPISDFQLWVGSAFAGASGPAVRRLRPEDPPGSTAPYGIGVIELDTDPAPWKPSDFGYAETTWGERAWAVLARKLARLVSQQPADFRTSRIRDRRLKAHAVGRLGSIGYPMRLLQRYRGILDRDLVIAAADGGALAYLATLPAIELDVEFLEFDTDCHMGTVTGTLGRHTASESAPSEVLLNSSRRRMAPPWQV